MGFDFEIRAVPPGAELAQAIADRNAAIVERDAARAELDAVTSLLEELRPIAARAVRADLVISEFDKHRHSDAYNEEEWEVMDEVITSIRDILRNKEPDRG